MKNLVRIESDETVVTNAGIFVRSLDDDEWVDIRRCVRGVVLSLEVGAPSKALLDIFVSDASIEAGYVDDHTLRAFASILRLMGWRVQEPVEGKPSSPPNDPSNHTT